MHLKDIPDLPARKYSRRISLAITEDSHEKLLKLRAMGKNPTEFARIAFEKALESVEFPDKKTG
jgi:hypothetical protein